jgi:hypothetical protein
MSETSSEQDRIESDLARTRARMDDRLTELQERLTPGQIIDDVMAYFRGHQAGDIAHSLVESVKNNPVPVALTGVGLTWLIASNTVGTSRPRSRAASAAPARDGRRWANKNEFDRHIRAVDDSVARRPDETESAFQERLNDARATALGIARDAQDTAESFGRRIQDALTSARQSVSDAVTDLSDRASNAARQMTGAARDQISQNGQSAQRMATNVFSNVADSPVMLGALSFAVGAVLGAVVPQSTREEEVLGDIARQARDGASALAQHAVDSGKAVTRQVVQAGQDAVNQHLGGKTAGGLIDSALEGDLVDTASKMVGQVVEASEAAIREAAMGEKPNSQAQQPAASRAQFDRDPSVRANVASNEI